MKHRRAEANERRPDQQQKIVPGIRQDDEANQGRPHADGQRVGQRPLVGVEPDERLQQRGGHLEGQRQQPDLAEIEAVIALQQWIGRRQQRLHHIVEQVAEAHRHDDGEGGLLGAGPFGNDGGVGQERRSTAKGDT